MTGIGTGLGGSFGAAAETVYGTFAAPTRFPEVTTAPFTRKPNFVFGNSVSAGRMVQLASRATLTSRDATGTVTLDVGSKGFGLFLNQLLGAVTLTQQGATTAWMQTHTLADLAGKSMTCQVDVPTTDGATHPYTFLGCKTTDIEFACGVSEMLQATLTFDAKDYSETQALATPSYLTGVQSRNFTEMNVRIGAVGAEAAVSGVRKVTTKISRPMNTARYYANGGGTKAEPLLNAFADISGTIETDFVSKADFADRVPLNSTVSLVWEFIGPIISSTYAQTFRITMPAVMITTGDPQLNGPDVVNPSFTFTALDDQTNPPVKVEYMSVDTAV